MFICRKFGNSLATGLASTFPESHHNHLSAVLRKKPVIPLQVRPQEIERFNIRLFFIA